MIHEKTNLAQLPASKAKLSVFFSALKYGNSKRLVGDDLKGFESLKIIELEVLWFLEFIKSKDYRKIKAAFPQLFWFSGLINSEQSYITVGRTQFEDADCLHFIIGDSVSGQKIYQITLCDSQPYFIWWFKIFEKNEDLHYHEAHKIKNTLLLEFEKNHIGKRRVCKKLHLSNNS